MQNIFPLKIRQNQTAVLILLFFGIIYCLISLLNHYFFRTATLDLGMNTHALYCFSRFEMNYFTTAIKDSQVIFFADHFSPITILYVPFYYIFGSYTLLIIQIAGILYGGWGIYRYSRGFLNYKYIPILLLVHFLSIWGIYSALSFDFHNNVMAAMFVPWLFYHYRKNNRILFLFHFFLILISKENMALWLAFIVLGLILLNLKNKPLKSFVKFEIPLVFLGLLYFIIVVAYVMPYLRQGEGFDQLNRYHLVGDSLPEILRTFVKRPLYVLSLLISDPNNNKLISDAKLELYLMVLLSGGWAILYRPAYLVMLIPVFAQKMLTSENMIWGLNNQYSIEFVPVISFAVMATLEKINKKKVAATVTIIVLIITIGATIQTMESRVSKFYNKTNTAFYYAKHYKSDLHIKEIYKQLQAIPSDVPISVGTNLSPHLANRTKIYSFPFVRDAEYIVVFTEKRSIYPLTPEQFNNLLNTYKNSPDWKILYDENSLLILKRR